MANTNFGQLKINLLRLAGNIYNSGDAVRLVMAGNSINRALSIIEGELKGHPYTMDTGNTVTASIVSPYATALADTDIIEVLDVSQRVDPRKMTFIPYQDYKSYMADPALFAGTPSLFLTALQTLNGSGQNIWSLYFIPTPSSAITLYYDYLKSLAFATDDSTSNALYSPFPTLFDGWIYDEAKPFLYEMIDSKNRGVIDSAKAAAEKTRIKYKSMILSPTAGYSQVGSARERGPMIVKRVSTTTAI